MRDLFVVVADLDAEYAIKTLLCERQQALGIQLDFAGERYPDGDMLRYKGRDSGCYKDGIDLLRAVRGQYRHAMILFDHHGSGAEQQTRAEIESDLEDRLRRNGWAGDEAAVIVIAPELEAWVWSGSPRVADAVGWADDRDGLRSFLHAEGLWTTGETKPHNPKEALDRALRNKQTRNGGAAFFENLSRRVSVRDCQDESFKKTKRMLQKWFSQQT